MDVGEGGSVCVDLGFTVEPLDIQPESAIASIKKRYK